MTDSDVYSLAQMARRKLSDEASTARQDLRRIIGHANMLDHLAAELVSQGYILDGDEEQHEDAETFVEYTDGVLVAEDETSCPDYWDGPVMSGARDDEDSESDSDTESSESSDSSDSDTSDDEDSYDELGFDFTEYFKDRGNGDYLYDDDVKASSRYTTVQVSVRLVSEFD